MRLNRYIAQSSGISRRAADSAIEAGRVYVDGKQAHLTTLVSDEARVTLDGRILTLVAKYQYLMLNKPVGYICSRAQQGSGHTIYELLPAEYRRLRSVGRLDRDSTGLLLLSDDGNFIHRHLHPSFGKDKRYTVTLSAKFTNEARIQLSRGVHLSDGWSRLKLISTKGDRLEVSLEEGRNRQIRRTFQALGFKVIELHRTSFGELSLGRLGTGRYRALTSQELRR